MRGLDYLAGAKYKSVILREHPEGWAAGFFSNVDGFGDALPTAEALLNTGRCPRIRFQLKWKDNHDFKSSDISPTVRECKRVLKLVNKFPSIEFMISPWCEHVASSSLIQQLRAAIKPLLPSNAKYINSAIKNGALLRDEINEYHNGGKPKIPGKYNFSFDGTSAVDADCETTKRNFSNAETFFFWVPQFNLRKNTNDKTPRPQRKAVPTGQLVDSVIYLKNEKGATSLPRRWLWKSHADQHNAPVPEPRALKPVLITPVKTKVFQLIADNGQVVATSGSAQSFNDGRFRYYWPDFGYLLAEKAVRIQGHPVCKLVANDRVYGRVNPAFRENEYRQ